MEGSLQTSMVNLTVKLASFDLCFLNMPSVLFFPTISEHWESSSAAFYGPPFSLLPVEGVCGWPPGTRRPSCPSRAALTLLRQVVVEVSTCSFWLIL